MHGLVGKQFHPAIHFFPPAKLQNVNSRLRVFCAYHFQPVRHLVGVRRRRRAQCDFFGRNLAVSKPRPVVFHAVACEVPWTGRVCRCVWRFSAARVIGVHDSGRRRRPGALCLGVHQEPFPVHFQFRGRAILDSFGVLRFLLEVGGVVDLLLKQSSVHRDPLCSELMMTRPAPLGLD